MNIIRIFKYNLIILFFVHKISSGLESDYSKPIEIESESGNVNLKTKDMEIIGNVIVNQGSLKINGNKISFQKENDKNHIINIYGSPSYFEQKLDNKNKFGKNQLFKGSSNYINYNRKNNIITLIGNAKIQIDKNVIFGNVITYNIKTEKFVIKSSSGKKINIVISPNNN